MLDVTDKELIRRLYHRQGWSERQIAAELGCARQTVHKYLREGSDPPRYRLTTPRAQPVVGPVLPLLQQWLVRRQLERLWHAFRAIRPADPAHSSFCGCANTAGLRRSGAMRAASLFPHLAGVRIVRTELLPDELIIEARTRAATARCPDCRRRSRHVHSRYTRKIADQPVGDRRVTVHLVMRRFRCRSARCPRRTFAESAPRLAARYARHTLPLQGRLQDLGLTLGGRPGARSARRVGIRVSRTTLLRRVRSLPEPSITAPRVLGVDDFALRRGSVRTQYRVAKSRASRTKSGDRVGSSCLHERLTVCTWPQLSTRWGRSKWS